MTTLHLVNNSTALRSCLDVAADADNVLLIEDGVYAATGDVPRSLLVLSHDAEARGLQNRISNVCEFVSYDKFVTLVEAHNPIVTWC